MEKSLAFISHNKADKEIAREIGMFLVADEVNVWFDEWEISAGDSIVEQINEGLKGCTQFIILWSDNSAKSNWVRRELNSTLSRAIETGSPKVIPIVLDNTPLPELLADLFYIKYDGGSEKDRNVLVRAITGEQPTTSFVRAIVKKYKELIYDEEDHTDPLPFKACPDCGCDQLKKDCFMDYNRDENYYLIECKECGWTEWTQ